MFIIVYLFASRAFVNTRHHVDLIIIDYRHSDFHLAFGHHSFARNAVIIRSLLLSLR